MSKTWDHAQNAAGTPIDERNCQLFGFVSILTQLLMGVVVLVTLLYKRHQERPRRAWQIWMLDVSKQLTGQLFVHILNVMFSAVGTGQDGINPCSLYFLNILLDTTLGTWLNAHFPPPAYKVQASPYSMFFYVDCCTHVSMCLDGQASYQANIRHPCAMVVWLAC